MARLLSILIVILCLGHAAHAVVWLELGSAPGGDDCLVVDPGPNELVTVYVLADNSPGDSYTYFRFAAPVPAGSGLTHIVDLTPFQKLGHSQSDISVTLGACESGTRVVLEMLFLRTSAPGHCVTYNIQAGAIYGDCTFAEKPMDGFHGVYLGASIDARNVSPADGATNVPLTTTLSWLSGCSCFLHGSAALFFGTNPDPPLVSDNVENPYHVGPLQPGTTYYWRVADIGGGEVWSFTTTNSVAVQSSTWGSVKALYR